MTDILLDALSIKLFGENVNPSPSMAWVVSCSEDEFTRWACNDFSRFDQEILLDRVKVQKQVEMFTLHEAEELEGVRHYVPPLEEDLAYRRMVPIDQFTLQKTRRSGSRMLATCVFHDDRHPSAVLYPNGRGFYCFTCGKGGNSIDWAMQEFGMSFKQAADFLKNYA